MPGQPRTRIEAFVTLPGYRLRLVAPHGAGPGACARALACALTGGRYLRNDVLDFNWSGYLVRRMAAREMSVYIEREGA